MSYVDVYDRFGRPLGVVERSRIHPITERTTIATLTITSNGVTLASELACCNSAFCPVCHPEFYAAVAAIQESHS